MPATGMGGRPIEIGSDRKRGYLFLKTVCMHACAHIYIHMLIGRRRTMSYLHQILKK